MTVYNLSTRDNHSLHVMHRVHEFLLMKSQTEDYVGYDELRQFYASYYSGPSNCAKLLDEVGIVYRDLHPTKTDSGRPKAIFFQDRELLAQAVDEIKAEIAERENRGTPTRGRRKWQQRIIRSKASSECVNNLDLMLNMFAPKRRNENVRSE